MSTTTTEAASTTTRPVTTATKPAPPKSAPPPVPTTTKGIVRVTTTSLAPAWAPSPESMVAVPNPGPSPLPPTTMLGTVPRYDRTAPGVELTPPYQAPTVTSVSQVRCTVRTDAPNHYNVTFSATLVGGRYWTYPGLGQGNTGEFWSGVANLSGRPVPFEYRLESLGVRTPDSAYPVSVPISPPVAVRCPSGQ